MYKNDKLNVNRALNYNVSMLNLSTIEDKDIIECYEEIISNNFMKDDEINFTKMLKILMNHRPFCKDGFPGNTGKLMFNLLIT
jgi:hypothetical protein